MSDPTPTRSLRISRELARDGGGWQLGLVALLSLLAAGSTLVLPWAVGQLISTLDEGGFGGYAWLLVGLGIGSALASAGATFLLSRLGQRMIRRLRVRVMDHSLAMKMPDIREEGSGNLVTRITADTSRLKRLIDAGPIQLPMAAVTTVGTLVIMGFIDVVLLLITVAAFSVAAVIVVLVVRGLRRSYTDVQEGTSALAQRYVAALDAVKMIKAFRAERQVVTALTDQAVSLERREVSAARMEALMVPAINLGQQIAMVAVIVGGGARLIDGDLQLGDFVAFLLYLLQLTGPLMIASSGVTAVKMGLVSRDRFDSLFAHGLEGDHDLPTGGIAPVPGAPAVEFRDVTFSYGDTPVLRGTDFTVAAQGLTAIVGFSGAGKTTCLELVQRFSEASGGSVRVFGRDVAEWQLSELRSQVAYLDQSSTLVQDSVRENLTLGRDPGSIPDAELMSALDRVGLANEIRQTPDGLDTVLAGATDLSGGQRQRLGIARAMLGEAPLVLLDEPSSQLDSVNEEKLRRAVDELATGRAVLVVAHRLSTVQHADHVVLLHEGTVLGQGSHEELMDSSPEYAELVRGQALAGELLPT